MNKCVNIIWAPGEIILPSWATIGPVLFIIQGLGNISLFEKTVPHIDETSHFYGGCIRISILKWFNYCVKYAYP